MENDIWKNLFELPLIETAESITEEALLALPEFTELFVGGEVPKVRLVCRDVKHVLSHRVLYANFYEVSLPEETASFSSYQKVRIDELEQYAVPKLIHAFLEKYV